MFIGFGLLTLVSMFEINELIEQKLILLLTISGAPEGLLWVSYHFNDLIFVILGSIIYAALIRTREAFSKVELGVALITFILGGLAMWAMGIFIVPFFKKSTGPKIFAVILLIGNILIPLILTVISVYPKKSTEEAAIKAFLLFLPQASIVQMIMNFEYNSLYLDQKYGFSNMNDKFVGVGGSRCLLFLFFSFLMYFGLYFIFFNLNPRAAGSPPIGWGNYSQLLFGKHFVQNQYKLHQIQ